MEFGFLQIIAIAFALFAISRAFLRVRESRLSKKGFLFWAAIWIGVIVVAIIPTISIRFSEIFGIGRGTDFLVYISIILLFYLMFRLYVKLEEVDDNFTKLVRDIAIKNKQKKK